MGQGKVEEDEKEEVGFFISFIRWHSFLFLSFLCSEGRSNDISLSLSPSLSLSLSLVHWIDGGRTQVFV